MLAHSMLSSSPGASRKYSPPCLNHVRINAKILDGTDQKLKKYLQFASQKMDTEITNDDVVEYALNLLFDRDPAFKSWLKQKA